jgi:hypothetical protein
MFEEFINCGPVTAVEVLAILCQSSAELANEPNAKALAPSVAPSELKNSEENSEAIDGCQQRLCSASDSSFVCNYEGGTP